MATVTEAARCRTTLVAKTSRAPDELMMPVPYLTEEQIAKEKEDHAEMRRYYQHTLLGRLKDRDWKSKPVFDDDDGKDSVQSERTERVDGRCATEEKTDFSQLQFKKWDDGIEKPEFNEHGFWWGKPW
ncbi:hypothetical protein LTR37_016140 [Vermiconidia calcicola]|uniref:Uncharacterized protein n=1 Tax=Vermiconidia calcicola TaxID=1690605 RepID=A0ACC3MNS5_9PEZI|nr:hypothetical protein LTR37_016140 [Vermiconidia calcicola]